MIVRIRVASSSTATARPKPICWNITRSPAAKPANTATMISAAPVMMPAVAPTPSVTEAVLSPDLSQASLMRLSRKTW